MRPDDDLEEINIEKSGEQESISPSTCNVVVSGPTKVVVADTSPLNYLIQIEHEFLLPLLYRRVIAPPIVVAELAHIRAPHVVARWAAQPPVWLEVIELRTQPDEGLRLLDAGERDAIQLAIELSASEVAIDEFKGRREARARRLAIVGTLGILIAGQRERLISAQSAFDRLITQTNIYIAPQLREDFIKSLWSAVRVER